MDNIKPEAKHFITAHIFLSKLDLSDQEFVLWKERIANLLAEQDGKPYIDSVSG